MQKTPPAKTLPLRHRMWRGLAATLLVLLLLSRNLYFSTLSLPNAVDESLQKVLEVQTLTTILGMWVDAVLLFAIVWVGIPLLLFRRRWVFQREGELWGVRPWLHSLAWLAILLNHAFFEVNLYIATACLLSLPMIVVFRDRPSASAAAIATAGFALFVVCAPDDADRLGIGLWAVVVAVIAWGTARVLARAERFALAVLLIPLAQVSPGYIASRFRLHDGLEVGDGMAYAFCESLPRGRIFAMVPNCGTRWPGIEECQNAVVEVIDARDPSRVGRYRILGEEYYGRIEEPVCLEDTIQVGMNRTIYRGRRLLESALELEMDNPRRVRPHILGEEGGHRIQYDARDDVLFYLGDDVPRVHRYERKTGRMQLWENTGPASARIVSADIHPKRRTLFAVAVDAPVREFRLDDLSLVETYGHGGGTEITVDAERDRFLVTGFFGLEVYDLGEGRPLLRRRTGFLGRRPALDPVNGIAVLSVFGAGKLQLLDLETLQPIGQIPVGVGTRYPYVSQNGRFLFAGSREAHFVWNLPELLHSMGR